MEKYLVSYNKHGVFCLPPDSDHRKAVWEIKNRKVHEPRTIKKILAYCGDGEVIHAGAYFGDMLPALKKCKRVWAFEPNFESYQCALKTIELNQLTNVELINAALGAEKGKARFKTEIDGKKWGGGSRIHPEGKCEVDVVTIDDIFCDNPSRQCSSDRKVTVIHLDIEGYEKQALMGGMKTLDIWRPVLILEKNNCVYSDWFQREIMDKLQYRRKKLSIHNNSVFMV